MKTDLQNLLAALTRRPRAAEKPAPLSELNSVRTALLQSVKDCHGVPTQRLHSRIARASTHRDLWDLRSEVYSVIATTHCQSVASERIGGVSRLFEGWVDPGELRSSTPNRRPPALAR